LVDVPPVRTSRDEVEQAMVAYMQREAQDHGTSWYAVARHMLGLRHGEKGARRWRQVWSDHRLKLQAPEQVHALALRALRTDAQEVPLAA
jgi:tRNA-dihydrouridine synthase A